MNKVERNLKIKTFLERVEEGEFSGVEIPYASEIDVKIARLSQESGYVKNLKIETDMSGGTSIYSFNPIITEKGYDLMNDESEEPLSITQNITFNGQVNSPVIGNNNNVTNNFNTSLEELEKFILTMPHEDQATANEILETVKTQEVQSGLLNRFSGFFEKHPKFVNALGQSAVWLLTNTDKIPFV